MTPRAALAVLVALLLAVAPGAAQTAAPSIETERAVIRAFEDGAYDRALAILDAALADAPRDPTLLYNSACALSRLGRLDESAERLLRAIDAGFRDADLILRDPDLAPLRAWKGFDRLREATRARRTSAPRALEQWRAQFGTDDYRYERDEAHHLAFATCLDETSHRAMRRALARQADQLVATLFAGPPDDEVLIAVPTPADAARLLDDASIGGIYQHDRRRLVARDTGTSLRHEFVHAMHYGDMERLGQAHPIWIQEGLAALYERVEIGDDGTARFLPNERQNIIRRRVAAGRALAWPALMSMSAEAFMDRATALYPQVRSIFEFVADEGRLSSWYRAYVEGFDADPTGARALERVFGADLDAIERRWRRWVLDRGDLDVDIGRGDAALGVITVAQARADGVLVERILPGSAAEGAGCRVGDVIVAVDDTPVASPIELRTIIAARAVGDRVRLRVRRGGAYLRLTVTLRPYGGAPRRR